MNEYYQSPLSQRYASKEMQALFSNDKKFTTWRRLWIALAESEKELGLDITEEQIEELKAHALDINYDVAKAREKEVRHDVMSHVYAYGVQCPKAKGIIHLGATSCYVGDNTDLIIMHEALELVQKKIVNVLEKLEEFALKYKDMPCLAFTHFQPAQPTTVGKRASLWAQDLYMDYIEIQHLLDNKKLLGCKGTTGTQASFMELFEGDTDKVKALDKKICEKLGYDQYFAVSGQTYTRKYDTQVLQVLVQIAPLANYIIADSINPAITASTQWFERTLDDSANKRISIAEAFLATDGLLDLYLNVSDGLVVYPKVVEANLLKELPFMATENIMMDAVKAGGDRQELHELIRQHSMAAGRVVKEEGKPNDLIDRIAQDPKFGMTKEQILSIMKPENFVGRSVQQTEEFFKDFIDPILAKEKDALGMHAAINV